KACVLPENPASYRVVRTKSYLFNKARKLIKKIEKTLKKVEDEDFGYCESCGVEIGIRRLEARPTADLCIDCKTLAEIREKQMAG
ncbi:TraR/DksA C4-type zinc finger protein, partial [Klebsiella pneumoniae]